MENKKDLKYFMRKRETEIVTVPGPKTFRDEEGKVIPFEIKKLTQEEIDTINKAYRERSVATDRKGNPLVYNGEVIWQTEKDNARASRHMLVEALQYPNLKDPDLMKFYGCVDITDMPLKVFATAEEYRYVTQIVMEALGLAEPADDKADLQAAKN